MRNTKNNGWKVAANIVFYGGVMACMLAAIAYLLLPNVVADPKTGPFEIMNIVYIAIVAVAFTLIAIVLRLIGNAADKKAVEVEINEAVEEIVEEVVEDLEEEVAEETDGCCEKCAAIRSKLTMSPETKEKVVATVKKNIPVIVAVVATAAVTTAIAKSAQEKKRAKARKTLLDFFY